MANATQDGPMLAADGTPLKQSLARSLRRQKMRALMLIAPLLVFVLLSFVIPIASMLFRSVENGIVSETLPLTVEALDGWDADGDQLPDEAIYEAFVRDMVVAIEAKKHTRLGSRLNYEETGMSSMFRKSGRALKKLNPDTDGPFKDQLIDIHDGFGELQTWRVIKTHSVEVTNGYFLNAIDMQRAGPRPGIDLSLDPANSPLRQRNILAPANDMLDVVPPTVRRHARNPMIRCNLGSAMRTTGQLDNAHPHSEQTMARN